MRPAPLPFACTRLTLCVSTVWRCRHTGEKTRAGKDGYTVDRVTKSTHASLRMTGVGGSTADGKSIRSAFIFPGATVNREFYEDIDHRNKVTKDLRPETGLFKDGKPVRSMVAAHGKGGMSDKMANWLLFDVFIPTFEDASGVGELFAVKEEPAWRLDEDNPFCRSDSADQTLWLGNKDKYGPGTMRKRCPVVVCDGHSSHLTCELLDAMADLTTAVSDEGVPYSGKIPSIALVSRVPHSSHCTQGEDMVNYKGIKPKWATVRVASRST